MPDTAYKCRAAYNKKRVSSSNNRIQSHYINQNRNGKYRSTTTNKPQRHSDKECQYKPDNCRNIKHSFVSIDLSKILFRFLFLEKSAKILSKRSEERRVGKECRCRWWQND